MGDSGSYIRTCFQKESKMYLFNTVAKKHVLPSGNSWYSLNACVVLFDGKFKSYIHHGLTYRDMLQICNLHVMS